MPDVTLHPSGLVLRIEPGENLFHAVRRHGRPLASSCDGDGVCDKCRVVVLAGMEHLSNPSAIEQAFRHERPFGELERMACQARVYGDITITTGYW